MSSSRVVLPSEAVTGPALSQISEFHRETVAHAVAALQEHEVLVIGMKGNPFCKKAKKALEGAQVQFHYWEIGGYLGEWKKRLAIKMWSGWPTFPQVFAKGQLVGGAQELIKSLENGDFKS